MNEPDILSNDDITDIISVITIDMIDAIDYESKEAILYNIRKDLILQLKQPKIKLTKLGINDLKNSIVYHYNQAKMLPGKMVGIIASQSLGQPIMQIVLNAFHSAGAIVKGVSAGYAPIIDILSAKKNLKTRYIQILFNKRYSMVDTINMREKYVNVYLKKLVKLVKMENKYMLDYILDTPNEIFNDKFPYWYHNFNTFYDNENNNIIKNELNSKYPMLRITLDMLKIFQYKVNIKDIYETMITRIYNKIDNSIKIFISPIIKNEYGESIIYLDIFPNYETIIKNSVNNKNTNNNIKIKIVKNFLFMYIIQELTNINIKGLMNIKDIYPGSQTKWAAIKYIVPYIDMQWQIWVDKSIMKLWNITFDDIYEILNILNIKIINKTDEYIIIESILSPSELYNDKDNENKKNKSLYEKEQQKLRIEKLSKGEDVSNIITIRPENDFEKLININYLEVNGYDLKSLYIYDEIDHYHTVSNDVNEIYELYGVESARNFIIYKLYQSINANGEYIDSSHIILIADQMTHLGILTPFNYEGMSGLSDSLGPLNRSMYQRILEVMTQASSMGTHEDITLSTGSLISSEAAPYGSKYNPNLISQTDINYIKNRYGIPVLPEKLSDNLIKSLKNDTEIDTVIDNDNFINTGKSIMDNDEDIDFTSILNNIGGMITDSNISSNEKLIIHQEIKKPKNLWHDNTLYKKYQLVVITMSE